MRKVLVFSTIILFSMNGMTQETIPLYPDSIPNSKPGPNKEKSEISPEDHILIISDVSIPTMTIFLPAKNLANGAAVIIYPGGGYHIVAAGHEGYDVAKEFNKQGIAAFVVKYRIPSDETMIRKEIGPLQDAQRAIELVRQNAKKWNIDSRRVGIMGFSAGGHLASTAGTHYEHEYISNKNHINLRPDFMILVYPVISFTDSIGHMGSRDNLLGKSPTPEKIIEYSNDLQVNTKTPPTYLVHAKDDDAVPVQNSIHFYEALRKNNVKAEIFLYDHGGHGFGLNNPTSQVKWIDLVIQWMKNSGWLSK